MSLVNLFRAALAPSEKVNPSYLGQLTGDWDLFEEECVTS